MFFMIACNDKLTIIHTLKFLLIQLNKYETAPNIIQLNQNLTSYFLKISLFLPVLPVFA